MNLLNELEEQEHSPNANQIQMGDPVPAWMADRNNGTALFQEYRQTSERAWAESLKPGASRPGPD